MVGTITNRPVIAGFLQHYLVKFCYEKVIARNQSLPERPGAAQTPDSALGRVVICH
jgi:hypothetical protein